MTTLIEKILYLMDSRIEVLERSNPEGITEKFLRKDFTDLKMQLEKENDS